MVSTPTHRDELWPLGPEDARSSPVEHGCSPSHNRIGADGAVVTRDLRNYHVPHFAVVPVTEVYFADTYDELGPPGAKSMSESPYNPLAPSLANAIARACGARLRRLPMTPARVWRALQKGGGS